MKNPLSKFVSYAALSIPLMLAYSVPTKAAWDIQLIEPPGSLYTQAFGINNAGVVTGNFSDDVGFYGYVYDIGSGTYSVLADDFIPQDINNSGAMAGSVNGVCAIRDRRGNISLFDPPSAGSACAARGINDRGDVSGYQIDDEGVWTGFLHDPKKGTYIEYLPSRQTIAQAITGRGDVAGSVFLFADEAFAGSSAGRYGYVRDKNSAIKYFAVNQAAPGTTRGRGLSDSGLVAGFYFDPVTFEGKSYVASLSHGSDFQTIDLSADQIVFRKPCNPDGPPAPGPGYDAYTNFYAAQVRNDGVVIGQCVDEYFNETTGDYLQFGYGFVATPSN